MPWQLLNPIPLTRPTPSEALLAAGCLQRLSFSGSREGCLARRGRAWISGRVSSGSGRAGGAGPHLDSQAGQPLVGGDGYQGSSCQAGASDGLSTPTQASAMG